VRPDGATRAFLLTPAATASVLPGSAGPALRFAGAAPNPVRGAASFGFELPSAGRASLVVHDLAGRSVRELASGWFGAGPQSVPWDGLGDRGERLAPGAYVARLVTSRGAISKRFVVIR
jgi:hypothetical protein